MIVNLMLRGAHEAKNFAGGDGPRRAVRPILDEFAALTPIAAAAALNERNVPSPRGGRWYAVQVVRMRKRLAAAPPRKARKSVMERDCLARNDVGVETLA